MYGWITYDFTSFSTVLQSYQTWVDDNERLCAMKACLRLRGIDNHFEGFLTPLINMALC